MLALLPLAACGSSDSPASTTATAPAAEPSAPMDLAAGAAYFETTCASCHGKEGHGDGAAAAALNPKPRNLADKAWQDSVDDNYLREIIMKGGAAVGKSPLMPPNPQLEGKEDVLNGIVAHVRSLAK